MERERFAGTITGVGSTSGIRLVIGRWRHTPYGAFDDVMIEQPDGHRLLLAPTQQIAEVIGGLYRFDEVVVAPVDIDGEPVSTHVRAPGLDLTIVPGRRSALGLLLHAVPAGLAVNPRWLRLIDPVARATRRGVHTVGRARDGRSMCYGVTDLHNVASLRGHWRGQLLGSLAPVDPPVRFGFGSTPRRPSIAQVVTSVELTASRDA